MHGFWAVVSFSRRGKDRQQFFLLHVECSEAAIVVICVLQDFMVTVSQLAMSRAQQAALSLIDRLEELALIPTFVQVCHIALCNAVPKLLFYTMTFSVPCGEVGVAVDCL